eukprot:TRINITY_DN1819_c0_g2_i1.p1 TRINITY_DN1819_c0_g2~~TRINITY_DN1819_c0_g2_i1.p1  ORF type:complete len:575 (+),score=138.94 TRINITY_DN1819_c0_g2_i1:75-1799(+)
MADLESKTQSANGTLEADVAEVHFGLLVTEHTYQTKLHVKNQSEGALSLSGAFETKDEDLEFVSFPTQEIASGSSAELTVQLYCSDHGHFNSNIVLQSSNGDQLVVPISATIMMASRGKPLLKDNVFRVPNPVGRIPISESEPESDHESNQRLHKKEYHHHQSPAASEMESLKSKLEAFNQGHLLKHYASLSPESQEKLLKDIKSVNLEELKAIYESSKLQSVSIEPSDLKPFPTVAKSTDSPAEDLKRWYETGLKSIAEGKVALILMAGGQATRLGVGFPKGMLDVGLPSGKSLFQIQAERIVRLKELAVAHYLQTNPGSAPSASVPLYIMTSPGQTEVVEKYHRDSNCFGLNGEEVKFFEQCTLPCVTPEGKIILENAHTIARAPDGHGGLYKALGLNGVHHDMHKRGCEYAFVYCVDNILVRVGDPTYIGYCIEKNFSFGYKVVAKAYPEEPAGVVCIRKGIIDYVEYSELPKEVAVLKNEETGELLYNAANILNLFYTRGFLQEVIEEAERNMQYHIAKKKIPHADETGQTVQPSGVNGWKFEKFVLDCTPAAKNNVGVYMVIKYDTVLM